MRFFKFFTALCLALGSASLTTAQEREGVWVQYRIDIGDPVVEGAFLVAKIESGQVIKQGYSLQTISRFIAEDCAAGKISKLQLGKQTKSRRRGETRVVQYFQTTCQGGIRADVRGTKSGTTAIVVQNSGGKDEATYRFGRNGDVMFATQLK